MGVGPVATIRFLKMLYAIRIRGRKNSTFLKYSSGRGSENRVFSVRF